MADAKSVLDEIRGRAEATIERILQVPIPGSVGTILMPFEDYARLMTIARAAEDVAGNGHDGDCDSCIGESGGVCSCGLDALRAALKGGG